MRVMSATLGDLPVITRKLDYVRTWNTWKSGLGVEGLPGITGKGSPHYYRFSLRRDVPNASLHRVAGEGDPFDVMLEAKEFMADVELSQDIIPVVPAARAAFLPIAPCAVLPRYYICDKLRRNLTVFCERLLRHFPERGAAVTYIRSWMNRTTSYGLNSPLRLHFLERADAHSSETSTSARGGVVRQHCVYPVKRVTVTRAESRAQHRGMKRAREEVAPMSFDAYIAQRLSQGASLEDAQREWNGMVIIQSASASAEPEEMAPDDE